MNDQFQHQTTGQASVDNTQAQPVQPAAQQPTAQVQQQTPPPPNPPRKPDYLAYQVQTGNNGKAYFNKIGAAWNHKDNQGIELNLDAIPTDGKVSLRTLREQRMQGYQQQQTQQATQDIAQQPTQGYAPTQ